MMNARMIVPIVTMALLLGCASSNSGDSFSTVSEAGGRIEGIELGSSGSPASLSAGDCYVPIMAMFRETNGSGQSNYGLRVHIITPRQPLEFSKLIATNDDGERILPGKIVDSSSHATYGDMRYEETLEIPLTRDDVRLLADTDSLQLYFDGQAAWAKPKISQSQIRAIAVFRDTYLN